MKLFAYTGTTFSPSMTASFEAGLKEAGWPKSSDGAGHTVLITYKPANGNYGNLDADIITGDGANDMTVAFGGLRPAHETHDSFERHFHLEPRRACFLAAGLYLSVFRDCGGNRVGQLPREPVDDVVHCFPPRAAEPGSRALPIRTVRTAYTRAVTRDRRPLLLCIGKESSR